MKLKAISTWISLVVLILFVSIASAQGTVAQVSITSVNAEEFPQVKVQVRAIDKDGVPVKGLSSSQFELTEDGKTAPVALTEVQEGLFVHFVIDAGGGLVNPSSDPRLDNAKNAIIEFVQTRPWMQEGLDLIQVSVVEASGPRVIVPATTTSAAVVSGLTGYNRPNDTAPSAPLSAIRGFLSEMATVEQAKGRPHFVVLLTANIESGGEDAIRDTAAEAKAALTPIYTVSLRKTPDSATENVKLLAQESGGLYTHFTGNNSLATAYSKLLEYRLQYLLTYDSTSGVSGTRQIAVSALVGNGSFAATGSYTAEVAPPRVLITSPDTDIQITRTASEFTKSIETIAPTSQTVTAQVLFPDNFPRRLVEAELLIDGSVVATATGSRELEFVWDLNKNLNQTLASTTYVMSVRVADVLGLEATSAEERKITIAFVIPEDVEDVLPPEVQAALDQAELDRLAAEKALQDAKDAAEAALIKCTVAESLLGAPEAGVEGETSTNNSFACNAERFLKGNAVGLSAIVVSLGSVVYITRSQSEPARKVRETVINVAARLTKNYRKSEAKAYIVVLEGDSNIGKSLEIYGDTPVGRAKENAELIFQQNDPSSPISRLHCTILDHENHFMIRDEDSANGTFLNGSKLPPMTERPITDGDEIELARVERGGVRLLFQLALGGEVSEDTRVTRPTLNPNGKASASSDDDFPQNR